ncbi:hypothetical protein [Formosa sp. PL04]|uniref:hypothetical protein n=1 Tax=Formosa sp. PL04 TaxID=3081755 RepID=UPI0029823E46|nr:hypothetical protein [Formosa sp. PL04]MDW5290121.1 hypothetical protein [Formosa sp. PL04]
MKKIKFYLTSCLLITALISCSSDDDSTSIEPDDNGITVSNITLSKQSVFVDDIISLDFDSEGQESIELTSAQTGIAITSLSETSYEITSSGPVSAYIDMTFTRDTITEVQQVLVNFLPHGVIGKTVEAIVLDDSNTSYLSLIHGEPDGKRIIKEYITNPEDPTNEILRFSETWYYASKGLSFNISIGGLVIYASFYGDTWSVETDEGTVLNGVPYPYDINGLGSFTDPEGILMDDVVASYGVPDEENKIPGDNGIQVYSYPTVFTAFLFDSDDVEDYEGKKVKVVTVN